MKIGCLNYILYYVLGFILALLAVQPTYTHQRLQQSLLYLPYFCFCTFILQNSWTPNLKKPGADPNNLNNYHPISKSTFPL